MLTTPDSNRNMAEACSLSCEWVCLEMELARTLHSQQISTGRNLASVQL